MYYECQSPSIVCHSFQIERLVRVKIINSSNTFHIQFIQILRHGKLTYAQWLENFLQVGWFHWSKRWRIFECCLSLSCFDCRHGGAPSKRVAKFLDWKLLAVGEFPRIYVRRFMCQLLISQQGSKCDEWFKVEKGQRSIRHNEGPRKVEERTIEKYWPVKVGAGDVVSWQKVVSGR